MSPPGHGPSEAQSSGASDNPGPKSGSPYSVGRASGNPHAAGPTTPVPSPTRPMTGPIVPAQPYPMRPPTIEVTQASGVPLRWVITIAAVFVVGVGVAAAIVVPKLLSGNNASPDPKPSASTGSPTPSLAASSAASDDGGLVVSTSPDLTDGRADEVIAMLDVYFNGINAKDYPAVASVLDPDGTVNPNDTGDMKRLADGTRSTQDSAVTLTSLADAGRGLLTAEVTFQSNQKAGDGPSGRPDETCTQWDVLYTLSHDGAYRIRQSEASSQPC